MLTAEALLKIIPQCTRSVPYGDGESVEVIDAHDFARELHALIAGQPEKVFAALVGMHIREANNYLIGRSPHERAKNPVKSVTIRALGSKSGLSDFHTPGPDSGPNAVRLVLHVNFVKKSDIHGGEVAVIQSVTAEA